MQNAKKIKVNADEIKEDILILRNKMTSAVKSAGAINIISTITKHGYSKITDKKGNINRDMIEISKYINQLICKQCA